jgi:signal transduction histidine kinase
VTHNPMHRLWPSVVPFLLSCTALALLTAVCSRLRLNLATVVLLYLIVVVLLSLKGSFTASAVFSFVAVFCLAYFFVPPIFSMRVSDPLNVVALIVFLAIALVVTRLISKVRKHAEAALSTVSYRVLEAEERERRRMAKNLHEDIGQRLALLVIEIEQLKTSPPTETAEMPSRVDALSQHTSEILTDVKTLAHELHSPRLEYLDIAAVMRSFCKEYSERENVEINFRSDNLPGRVLPDISLCLFRVLQEALNNAVKHSQARLFEVKLLGSTDSIQLTVCDSGVGFDPAVAQEGSGFGLDSMRERLTLVKGIFLIDSQPQRGTRICAEVPLSSDKN